MMDKRNSYRGFALLAVAFLFGSVTGTFAGYSADFQTLTYDSPFGQSLFSMIIFPAAAVLLGTSLAGVILLPLLSAVKGFTLSYSLSVIFSVLSGGADRWHAVKPHVVSILVSVAVLFMLSTQALYASLTLLKLGARLTVTERLYGIRYWVNVLVCALALILTSVLSKSLT